MAFVEPMVATLVSIFILKEGFRWMEMFGVAAIFVSIVLLNLPEKAAVKAERPSVKGDYHEKIGICGTGLMGASMAQIFAEQGYETKIYGRTEASLERAKKLSIWRRTGAWSTRRFWRI